MSDHWCVAYADGAELQALTSRGLSEGLAQGEQVGFFGWGDEDALRAPLAGLADVDALLRGGAARVGSLDERFRRDQPPGPPELVGFWAEATEAALDAGFSGLRVVEDTTPWAKLAHDQRAVFLHGEQLINRYRRDHPFTLICACDSSVLTVGALAETASVHPQTDGVAPAFKLYSTGPTSLAAQGDIDAFTEPALSRVLDFVPPVEPGAELLIDAVELTFIDHRSLLILDEHARRSGLAGLVLDQASSSTAKVVDLLGLQRVRVEAVR